MATNEQVALQVLISVQDQASEALDRVRSKTVGTRNEFQRAVPALRQFGSALTSLLVLSGGLDNKMGRWIITTLAFANAVSALSVALPPLIAFLKAQNVVLRAQVVLQSILAALTGIGVAKLALAAGVGVAAFAATSALTQDHPSGGGSSGGNTYIFNGPVEGNEQQAMRQANLIQRTLDERRRLGQGE